MAANPVYLEIVNFFASGTTPQAIIEFQPSPEAKERFLALLKLAEHRGRYPGRPIGNGTLLVEAIAAPVGPAQVAPVPEPASWTLLGAGLLLGGALRRWRPRYD